MRLFLAGGAVVVAAAVGVFVLALALSGGTVTASRGGSAEGQGVEEQVAAGEASGDAIAGQPAQFASLSENEWAAIARNPDQHEGRAIVIFAEVTQVDAATGSDALRANVGATQPSGELELETNSILGGDAVASADVTEGDVLRVDAVVAGSFTYENLMGGQTSAVELDAVAIERVGFLDLSPDVTLGAPVTDEFGGVDVPVTITNSGSKAFDYHVEITAVSADGATQYESSSVLASSLQPGQVSEQEAMFFGDLPADVTFTVTDVERFDF